MQNITEQQITNISRFMSKILRHQPEAIGLTLDTTGWADTSVFLEKMNQAGKKIDMELLEYVVANNNKKRFAFNEDKSQIRASQGHTIEIELGYQAVEPPTILYHGTAEKNLASIFNKGILKGERHQVHLSADIETAMNVGKRHGKPVILKINAAKMHEKGIEFYQSENGVWLTEYVEPRYFSVWTEEKG
ncbi:MAG: RNA 2'-phosphotransferase [Bacteroidia bacterium]